MHRLGVLVDVMQQIFRQRVIEPHRPFQCWNVCDSNKTPQPIGILWRHGKPTQTFSQLGFAPFFSHRWRKGELHHLVRPVDRVPVPQPRPASPPSFGDEGG